jgi:acetate kinase
MNILVLNAGSASLKFEVIATPELPFASDKQHKLVSGIVEGIGEEATSRCWKTKRMSSITTDGSRLHAYVIPVEEGLLIAEQTLKGVKAS